MTTNIDKAVSKGLDPYRIKKILLGSKWADENFYLSPESSGTEGRWKSYPYQIAIINWMTSDDIEELNWQKSRRVGYTKCLLAAVACLIVQKNRNVAIWQPTDGDAKDFTTDEVDNALRDVPIFGNKLRCEIGAKSKYNTLEKKVFYGATLDIKGGKSARNFRRMTKDVVVYDELSAFDADIDNEGAAVELGDGRLDQAPFPKSIRGSTSKAKGTCQIEAAVENSDMLFYRFVKCPHCGTLQRLKFSQFRWTNNDPETVYYVCPASGCIFYYKDYSDADLAGRWQTLDGFYYNDSTDQFYNPINEIIVKPRRIGARIWAAYSYLRPWSYLIDKWIQAEKDAETGKITTLKAVTNTLIGETYEDKGESVDSADLENRGEPYLSGKFIPNGVLIITAGGDVQGGVHSRIEMEIVGHGLQGETWSLGYYVLPGDIDSPQVWDLLDEHLKKRFVREDGVNLGVRAAFIDSGYLSNEVYKFTGKRRRRNIYATKGVNTGTLCNAGTQQGDRKKRTRAILHTVNVDDAKTIFFNRLRIAKPGPGYCHFPDFYSDRHFTQLTNEKKVEKYKDGILVGHEWVKQGWNEQLDCRVYSLGALEFVFDVLKVNLNKETIKLERKAAALVDDGILSPDPPSEDNFAQQAVKKRRKKIRGIMKKKGFVNSWK